MKFYDCGQLGHPTYSWPKKGSTSQVEKRVNYVQQNTRSVKYAEVNLDLESGENLMFRRILIKEPTKVEPKQRRELFRV